MRMTIDCRRMGWDQQIKTKTNEKLFSNVKLTRFKLYANDGCCHNYIRRLLSRPPHICLENKAKLKSFTLAQKGLSWLNGFQFWTYEKIS